MVGGCVAEGGAYMAGLELTPGSYGLQHRECGS
jgi:hypothetical protein